MTVLCSGAVSDWWIIRWMQWRDLWCSH